MVEVESRMETLDQKNVEITENTEDESQEISVQFVSESGEAPFPPFEVPKDISPQKLLLVLKAFLPDEEDQTRPYLFFVNNKEVSVTLAETLKYQLIDYESTISIVYQPGSRSSPSCFGSCQPP